MKKHSLSASRLLFVLTAGCLLTTVSACSDGAGAGDGDGGDGSAGDGDMSTGGLGDPSSGGSGAAVGGNGAGGLATGVGGGGPGTGGTGLGTGGSDTGTPKRTFLYVGSGDWASEPGKVTVFEVNRTAKTLSFVSDIDAGGLASYLAIDVENERLFVADEKNGGVLAFTIDSATGSLTGNGNQGSGNHPVYLSLTPDKQYLLGANYGEGNVDVYPIDGSGQVGASVQEVSTGTNAHCIVMEGSSRVLVANKGGNTISRFNYASGSLTPQNPATTSLTSPRHITVGPDGRVYVVSEEADLITAYTVAGDGQLSVAWQEGRLDTGAPASNTGADIRVTPNGSFLYATNRGSSNTIVAYDISSGTAEYIEHESTQGSIPRSMAMDPRGEFVVVGNRGDNKIALFTIEADGSLTHALTENFSASPYFVTLVDL